MQKIVESGMKLDLHIHSIASASKDGKKVKNNTIDNIPVLISKLNENAVNICAITDHDAFSYEMYSTLKHAENDTSSIKKVLPGVEFSVRFSDQSGQEQAVHIVAIFNDNDEAMVKNVENVLKINRPDEKQSYTEEDFIKVLKSINLDTILIAHQKNTLTSTKVRKDDANSLGEEKFLEFVYSDYFEAFEFKNRKNEVLNKNYLSGKGVLDRVRFVTGSDCHDWSVYPKEDKCDTSTCAFPYTYAKCLPTFRGLVMAMTDQSRLKMTNSFYCVDKYALDLISIGCGKDKISVPLSKGINVIIGDNSVGKSMLLHALTGYSKDGITLPPKVKAGYQAYLKELGIKVDKQIDKDNVFCFDMQGEVRSKFETKNFDSSRFLSDHFPAEVDSAPYRALLTAEIDRMIQYLAAKFSIDEAIKRLSRFKIISSEGVPESIIFENNLRSTKIKTDPIDKIVATIKEIMISYNNLMKLQLDYADKVELRKHTDFLSKLQRKYEIRITQINSENERKELVAKAVEVSSAKHARTISDSSKRAASFLESTNALKESLREIITSTNELQVYKPQIETTHVDAKSNHVHDYEFISKLGVSCIDTAYYLSCLSAVLKQGKTIHWESITEEKLKSILMRYDDETPVLQFFKDALLEKITEDLKPQRAIINQGVDRFKELSSGMNSKIYFDLLTYETHKGGVYIIDQPEDNVSQKAIKAQLLKSFKFMGENRQVIMVTHNPQFIVNLDVDNVIYVSKQDGHLQIQSGALEYECADYKMLDIVANNIDGGLDSIQKRWKRYEKASKV